MPAVTEPSSGSLTAALLTGARGLCPRCRGASIFAAYLTIAPLCPSCGLGFSGHDAGDAPAFAGVCIMGVSVVALAILLEFKVTPPLWVHMTLWPVATLVGTVLLLRPLKGITVALQYRYRSVDGDQGGV